MKDQRQLASAARRSSERGNCFSSLFHPRNVARFRPGFATLALAGMVMFMLSWSAFAVAPTQEALDRWKAQGVLDERLAAWRAFLASGGCSASAYPRAQGLASLAGTADTQKVLVLLVQFSDKPLQTPVGGIKNTFDSILFSDKTSGGRVNPTGSMIDYYREVSYGKLKLNGYIYGPYTASQPYTYYVGTDNGFSHSPELVREVLTLANPDIDYSQFAISGRVPSVVVIHAGAGAEEGAYGIWSHKSSVGALTLDGVNFRDYTINPELSSSAFSNIGVFCHEYGHVLGLPDLYDTQNNPGSEGVGNWSLMASGNYNGGSRTPAHPDAWCKIQLKWLDSTAIQLVSSNRVNASIPAVEYNQVVYKIPDSTWISGGIRRYSTEYWLVENRQKRGSDVGLPASGLLIYHIDDGVSSNTNPSRYHVAVEQADGLNSLAFGGSRGDNGDPWPGSTNNRTFDNFSSPNSKTNVGPVTTEVAVWNISNSDSVMTANMDYSYSHPLLKLEGSDSLQILDTVAGDLNDSIVEAGETATFYCKVRNYERPAYNWTVSMTCSDPDVQFLQNNVVQGPLSYLTPAAGVKKSDGAIIFQLSPQAKGSYATFTLTITADSVQSAGDRTYSSTFQFKKLLGTPRLLIVDDDNGQTWEKDYQGMAQRLGVPFRTWNKASGSPTGAYLSGYQYVVWEQGGRPTGTFATADVTALKQYLDGHGNLLITGPTGADQLQALDPTFMQNYLHAQLGGLADVLYFFGVSGNPVTDGTNYRFGDLTPDDVYSVRMLTAVGAGQVAFGSSSSINGIPNSGYSGVTYNGTFRTILLTTPAQFYSYIDSAAGFFPPDSLLSMAFEFFDAPPFGGAEVATLAALHENSMRLTSLTPTFAWHVYDTVPYAQQSYEIAAGTDTLWDNAELWNPSPVTTTDTQVVYNGTPLTNGQTFYVRVRANNGTSWTAWKQSQFHVNSAPGTPTLSSPGTDVVVGNHPSLTVNNVTDPENDAVTYEYEVYSDAGLTQLEQSVTGIAAGSSTTSWSVPGTLVENQRNWWRVRSYDGLLHSAWSSTGVFWEDAVPEAPTAACTISPLIAQGPVIYTDVPQMVWHLSTDPDPLDTVHYRLQISTDAAFSTVIQKDSLYDTTFTLTTPLTLSTHFWWRLIALDKTSLQGTCSQPGEFWTWRPGDMDNTHVTDGADLARLVSYLTGGGAVISPKMLGDVSGDCMIDPSDLARLVSYLTGGGATLTPGCNPPGVPGVSTKIEATRKLQIETRPQRHSAGQ